MTTKIKFGQEFLHRMNFFVQEKNNLPLQITKYKIRISATGVKFVYAIHFYIVFHITKPNIGLLLFKMPMQYQGRLG